MSYTSNYNLNQRLTYLESLVSGVFVPTLAGVLQNGNSAGTSNIDLSGNNLVNVNQLTAASGAVRINTANRVFQNLNAATNWDAVNGFYGLDKNAYPTLNPFSSGVKAVSTWNARVTNTNGWISAAWAPSAACFVAVASSGTTQRFMRSTDGITWTLSTSTASNNWSSVCWAPELNLFAAVANSGAQRIVASPTGVTWTARTNPVTDDWSSVCWSSEQRLFVAVASGGSTNRVMTSSSGTVWQTRVCAAVNEWRSVCWAPELGLFVAVASSGTGNRVMTSNNGANWISRLSAADNDWRSVCWSRALGLFVAVASSGTNRVMTSPNGINWTLRNAAAQNEWYNVVWSAELKLFVAVASSGTGNRVMQSADGITWTTTPSALDNTWRGLAWSPELGIFAATSISGNTSGVMTSMLRARPPTSYNVFDSPFNNIDASGNWAFKAKEIRTTDSNLLVETTSGNLELKCNSTGVGGSIRLSGGTNLVSDTAGGSAGQHLALTVNGTPYKIQLLNP